VRFDNFVRFFSGKSPVGSIEKFDCAERELKYKQHSHACRAHNTRFGATAGVARPKKNV